MAVVPPAPMATEVLAIAVTDKPVAKAQSPVAVTRMVPASAAAVGQVPERWLTPRGHSPTTVPRDMAQCLAREGQQQSAKEVQQRSQLDDSRNLPCFPCVPKMFTAITQVARREPSSCRSPQKQREQPTLLRNH